VKVKYRRHFFRREAIFTVELVDANSGEPFAEHVGPDGKTYAEVEPDAEYFIKVSAPRDHPKGTRVQTAYEVDGVNLGYYDKLWAYKNNTVWAGSASRRGGAWSKTSLKFAGKPAPSRGKRRAPLLFTGRVVVTLSASVPDGAMGREGRFDTQLGPCGAVVASGTKGGVESVRGTVADDRCRVDRAVCDRVHYRRGTTLGRAALYYCTATGLARRGVLPRPPPPSRSCASRRAVREDGGGPPAPGPKRIRIGPVVAGDGATLLPGREVDFFDLTEGATEGATEMATEGSSIQAKGGSVPVSVPMEGNFFDLTEGASVSREGSVDLTEGGSSPMEGDSGPTEGDPGPMEGHPGPMEGDPGQIEGSPGPMKGDSTSIVGCPSSREGASNPTEGASNPTEKDSVPTEGCRVPAEGDSVATAGEPVATEERPGLMGAGPMEGASDPTEEGSDPTEGRGFPTEEGAGPTEGCNVRREGGPGPMDGGPGPTGGTPGPTEGAPPDEVFVDASDGEDEDFL